MRKKNRKLVFYISLIVFVLMLVEDALMLFVFLAFQHLIRPQYNDVLLHGLLLLVSVSIGLATSFFVAKKLLNPIAKFSDAAAKVAKGNFDIRLEESKGIEEIRELTQNFNFMVKELSATETLGKDFVVNVSHEFKTPIAAIAGYAKLLQDKALAETERCEYAQMIIDSSRQLSTLSDHILKLVKLEHQDAAFEKNSFRLDEQIRQVILMLETEWSRKELDLRIELEKITYCGSEQLLWQVWTNLIGNAMKFTPPNGSIEFRLVQGGRNAIARLSDTGCGMGEEVKKHIFDRFYQGDPSRKSEGNGLGLALVKRIVDLCDGKITVESKIGEGTAFTVTLPMVTE